MAVHNHNQLASPAWQRHRAARSLAHHADDAGELVVFLDMLGLTAAEGRELPHDPPIPVPRRPRVKLDANTACRLENLLHDVRGPAS